MKSALIVLSLCAIAALVAEIIRFHSGEFTRWAVLYLFAQFCFMFVCWRAAAHFGWSSLWYARTFYGSMGVMSVTATALALRFSRTIPRTQARMALIEICLAFVAIVCGTFLLSLSHAGMLNPFSAAHVGCAGVLVFCGVLSLASLAFAAGAVDDLLRVFLGVYFLAQGMYGLAEPALYLRHRSLVVARMAFVPLVISAVVFSSLALILRSYQREGSRASFVQDVSEEAR